MTRESAIAEIWLEVSNIAFNGTRIDVQLKGDLEDDCWLQQDGTPEQFKALMEAMKDKRPIHAKLAASPGATPPTISVQELRVSFAASSTRS